MRKSGILVRRGLGPLVIAAGLLGSLCGFSTAASAQGATAQAPSVQNWPQRPVKFILPFGAGSATDVAARMMSEKLAARWGKAVVIENKPGADGLLAIGAFVQANDDHVLLYASSASFNAHPYMHAKLPYVLARDLAPIAQVTDTILATAVPSSLKVDTLADFVALAQAQPGKLSAAGAAGVPDFTLGYFLKAHKLDVTKSPSRDIVPAASDLAAGQIQFLLSSAAILRSLSAAGKIKMLAVTARQRVAIAPNIPTIYEAGFPALKVETTAGLYGPKTMPRELRERLSKDVIAVVSDAAITAKLTATGQAVRLGGPEELTKTLKEQADQMVVVAKGLGMKAGN